MSWFTDKPLIALLIVSLAITGLIVYNYDRYTPKPAVKIEKVEPAPRPLAEDRFPEVVKRTLLSEGGSRYTNHPNDPGGPTKYGITIHDVRRYLKPNATASDVKALTEKQAVEIYRHQYWEPMKCDLMPAGLDYTVFDYTVNAGQGRAGRSLRKALGLPTNTAAVTPDVIEKIDLLADPVSLIKLINTERLNFQLGLGGKYRVFHKGWKARILSVRAVSLTDAGTVEKAFLGTTYTRPMRGPGKTPGYVEDNDVF